MTSQFEGATCFSFVSLPVRNRHVYSSTEARANNSRWHSKLNSSTIELDPLCHPLIQLNIVSPRYGVGAVSGTRCSTLSPQIVNGPYSARHTKSSLNLGEPIIHTPIDRFSPFTTKIRNIRYMSHSRPPMRTVPRLVHSPHMLNHLFGKKKPHRW